MFYFACAKIMQEWPPTLVLFEIFVGCLNGTTCGTFETTYTFTGKYVDVTFAQEIHGRCEHSIVGGTGGFAGAKGVLTFKDDVVNLNFAYRGHISLE